MNTYHAKKEPLKVVLYEDDEAARAWVNEAKHNYRDWAQKVPHIDYTVVPDPISLDRLLKSESNQPDLLIVDLDIQNDPDAGYKAIKRFRQIASDDKMPIVVFSASYGKPIRQTAYSSGATSFVKKPANKEKRIQALADIFGYWLELHMNRP